MVQEIWNKLNPNERIAAYGGIILLVVSLIGYAMRWGNVATFGLLAGLIVLGLLYVKNAPNMSVTWPAPFSLILLIVGGVALILLALQILPDLRFIAGVDAIVIIGLPLGAALVTWGAWQEYQQLPKAPASENPPAPPPSNPPA
jgi:hypothetical protein